MGSGAALLAPLPGGLGLSGGALPDLPGLVRPGGLLLLGRGGFPALGGLPALPISVGAAAPASPGAAAVPALGGLLGRSAHPLVLGGLPVEHRLQGGGQGGGRPLQVGGLLRLLGLAQLGQLLQGGLHIALGPLALAVADDAQLAVVVALGGLRGGVQPHLHRLPQQVHRGHGARPVGGLHKGLGLGGGLYQILIGLLLVLQAAHEPPAGAGDLGGVQGQVLGLGHLDGHGLELVQEGGAAEGLAADAQAAQHLGLVPHADLAQLDAGVDGAGQVLHQGPEVHPALGGEEEEDLVPLKAPLRVHQLHLQAVLQDLLLADLQGLGLLLLVLLPGELVLRGGPAEHRAQGGGELHLVDGGVPLDALAELSAPGGLYNDPLTGLKLGPIGVEIVMLSAFLEADADDLDHSSSLCEVRR